MKGTQGEGVTIIKNFQVHLLLIREPKIFHLLHTDSLEAGIGVLNRLETVPDDDQNLGILLFLTILSQFTINVLNKRRWYVSVKILKVIKV
ncbi:hypothetical protein RIR_jg10955.t1 [Rhizophagus irregularis DAOM 181602=DAOM 197198]|nr:hypothetical protein RIR_jg10955.t1 [Rhizophagus irregularis DAOM 181602=DAOM 197198]